MFPSLLSVAFLAIDLAKVRACGKQHRKSNGRKNDFFFKAFPPRLCNTLEDSWFAWDIAIEIASLFGP